MSKTFGFALAMFGLSAIAHQSLVRPPADLNDRTGILLGTMSLATGVAMVKGRRRAWTSREEAYYRLYLKSRGGRLA